MSTDFIELADHSGFVFKNLFQKQSDDLGRGDFAIIEPGGGGPFPSHKHSHAHLFVVIEGEVDVILDKKSFTLKKSESFSVPAEVEHYMINNSEKISKVIGIEINS